MKAIEVTEDEIEGEVSRALRTAARPGRLDKVFEHHESHISSILHKKVALDRRSARMSRLADRLQSLRRKARSLSANTIKT